MNRDRQRDLRIRKARPAAFLPPALVEETGWDILLALHSDHRGQLRLEKLASIASVPRDVIDRWLGALADQYLIATSTHGFKGEVHAALTRSGRHLIDNYLSATIGLQAAARH